MSALEQWAPVEPAEEVARVVTAESGWVPRWQRLLTRAGALAFPLALLLASAGSATAATAAALAALITRVTPWWVAAGLRERATRGPIRGGREHLLQITLIAGLVTLVSTTVCVGDPAGLLACLCAAVVVVAPHHPRGHGPVRTLVVQAGEAAALVGLLPAAALATRGWWG